MPAGLNRLLIASLVLAAPLCAQTYTNPVGRSPIHMGDPFALWHNGKYYLFGTTSANEGFQVYVSGDLADWKLKGWAWRKTTNSWADALFWAPEVEYYRGKFYMTYSGRIKGSKPAALRIALAVSNRPEGPYRDLYAPWFDAGFSAIDGHIFVDDGGKPYLFFSRNGSQDGYSFGMNYGVELAPDLSRIIGEPVKLMEAEQEWERANWAWNRCNEGPAVFKHRGRYYMTYSANHTGFAAYGVGYATAEKPLGPWVKARENPILLTSGGVGVSAPGYNSIVQSPDGTELFIVYHSQAKFSANNGPENPYMDRVVNIDRLNIDDRGRLLVAGPTRSPQPLPSGVRRKSK